MKVIVNNGQWLDVVKGADFEEFAVNFQQMQTNPDIEVVVIPYDIDFEIPFMQNIFECISDDLNKRRATARFQICYWACIDPKFHKPIALSLINSLDELRLLSGLGPQIETLYISGDQRYSNLELEDIRYAAGDR